LILNGLKSASLAYLMDTVAPLALII